jgi:leucyl aminopeptidase (aminopeptidase T)
MFFGPYPDELRQGATNAVRTCLGIKAGEHVALIADEASRAVAAAIEEALADQGAITSPLLIEALVARPMTTAPPAILEALNQADAGILCGRRAAADPLCAHGRRDAADHAGGDAR